MTTRRWVQLELLMLLLLVQIGLWVPGKTRTIVTLLGLTWVGVTTILDLRKKLYSKQDLGLVWQNSLQTGWVFYYSLVAVGIIWLLATITGITHGVPVQKYLLENIPYFLGAIIQSFFLNPFVFVRLKRLYETLAVLLAALMFSWMHQPNPVLMIITFAGGYLSCTVFNRYRNYWVLALAHGLIGAAIAAYWPKWVMQAGIGFFRLGGFSNR